MNRIGFTIVNECIFVDRLGIYFERKKRDARRGLVVMLASLHSVTKIGRTECEAVHAI